MAGFVTRGAGSEAKTLALLAKLDGLDEHVTAVGNDEVNLPAFAARMPLLRVLVLGPASPTK